MKILLDENMPESVRRALAGRGHEVDSIDSLRLKGLDNRRLYRDVARSYDLCFTKDRGFADTVRASGTSGAVRLVRVVLPPAPAREFTEAFLEAFDRTDWSAWPNATDWPPSG